MSMNKLMLNFFLVMTFEALKYHNIKAAATVRLHSFGMLNIQKNKDNRTPPRSEKELKKCGGVTTDDIKNYDKQVALMSWYDNKCVNLGSNFIAS